MKTFLKTAIGGIFLLYFTTAGALTLPNKSLSSNDVTAGLKEALALSTKNATELASRVDGFYRNPEIFIPFPPEAIQMKNVLERVGLKSQVEKFIMTMNRAAEEATKKAAPIFLDAIKKLTIQGGVQILKGPDNAATQYLWRQTGAKLNAAFRPVVHNAIDKVGLAKLWEPLAKQYNRIPLMGRVDPNLDTYVTQRAVAGLFKLIGDEEKKIRQNPSARVNDILQRVFGSLGK